MSYHAKIAKVSIIMPTYNGGRYIGEAIESALHQTFQNFELIVVDDGSTDKTGDIVKCYQEKDPRIQYFYKTNAGVASACNFGIEKAQGEFIAFFEHDDISFSDRLRKQMEVFYTNFKVSLVYSSLLVFHNNEQDEVLFGVPEKIIYRSCKEQFQDLIRKGCFFNNPSLIFKKDVWIKYKFNEQLPNNNLGHDYLFILQVSQGYLFCGIKEPLVRYRRSGSSLSADRKKNFEADKRVLSLLFQEEDRIFNISYRDAISLMYLQHARIAMYSKILPHNVRICLWCLLQAFLIKPVNLYIYKNILGLIVPFLFKRMFKISSEKMLKSR